jgi:disulfide bond formation protein DsbB
MVSRENLFRFLSIISSLYFYLAVILFAVYLVAPLLGGRLYLNALVIYGSWIGMAFALKYFLKKRGEKISLKWHELLVFTIYSISCMFLWFSYPLNIFFSLLIIAGNFISYRKGTEVKPR